MDITEIPVGALKPYKNNAKIHTKEQIGVLAKSIKNYGFIQPVVVDSDLKIIIGHGRVLGAKELGMEKVPCVAVRNLTAEQVNALRIADNAINSMTGFDDKMLSVELQNLSAAGIDITELGVDSEFIDNLELDLTDSVREDIQDDVPEKPVKPKSKVGDIYQLGEHRIMCGDATNARDVGALMGGVKAQLVVTDPPYNVGYTGGTDNEREAIKSDDMPTSEFEIFLSKVYASFHDNMRAGAVIYVCHASMVNEFVVEFNKVFKYSQTLIWNKSSATFGRQDYNWKHEPILLGWKEGAGHYFCGDFTKTTVIDQKDKYDKMSKDELIEVLRAARKYSTVIDVDKPNISEYHPTTKPIELIEQLVKNSSKPKWLVLDLFLGSGSTLIACEKTGRVCNGMELDPQYIDVIIKRWENYSGKKAVKL